jgi:putative transcriptional regulator
MRMSVRSRWQTALVSAVLVSGSLALAGLAHAQESDGIGPGTFLVAPRRAADPSFAGTVVLLVRSDHSGALGLVINRPTDVPVSAVLQDYKPAPRVKDHAFSGGPVQEEALLALYRSPKKIEETSLIFQDVYLVSTRPALEHIFRLKPDPRTLRVYMGYTGWGPGQLQHEMDLNVWRVLPADADSVFAADPSAVWQKLIERTELRFALNILR